MGRDSVTLSGRSLLAWYKELIEDGAEKLWVDREVFDALIADPHVRWTPRKPAWDDVPAGAQIAHVDGVPLFKG